MCFGTLCSWTVSSHYMRLSFQHLAVLFCLLFRLVAEEVCGLSLSQSLETFRPSHEIMILFVLRKLILQTRMHSHPVGLDVWFLVGPFVHTSCVRTAKALARLHGCAGSPETSLVVYVISTIISWAGSFAIIFDATEFESAFKTSNVSIFFREKTKF